MERTVAVDCDVVVVGLGAMGGHALWRLAGRRGVSVTGVEQFAPGHDQGSSHGESRIFRTAYLEGASYVPLLRQAWRLWAELERETSTALVVRTGCLTIGAPDTAPVAEAEAAARAHGLDYEVLDEKALRRRFPQHLVKPSEPTIGLYEKNAGLVRPERAVRSAVAAAVAKGARVLTGARVTQIVCDERSVRVRIGEHDLVTRHVVVAAGAWLGHLVPVLRGQVRVVRRVSGWFAARQPAAFGSARFPAFIRGEDEDRRSWYGCPGLDGSAAKVAVHSWPGIDEVVDSDAGPRPTGPADARLLTTIVSRTLHGLDPEPVRMSPCTYTVTPDQHFLLGRRKDLPRIVLLGGFSGHGFKFAPLVGEIAANLVLEGGTAFPIDMFDPHRFDSA